MKRPDGVTVISLIFFLASGLLLLSAILFFLMSFWPPGMFATAWGEELGLFSWTYAFMGAVPFLGSLPYLIVGLGLWRLKKWARWGAIILAIPELFAFPLGTVIGGGIIWYLIKQEVKKAFED